MSRDYIERRSDALYIAGTRVSLESVIFHFREGASPETILNRFPALGSLANVYGAIAFSLDNPAVVEEYLAQQRQKWDAFSTAADPQPPGLLRKTEPTNRAQ